MSKTLVSLVTGGASGLGKATVERLIKDGGKVVLCDLPTSKGQELADSIGSLVKYVPTDVTSIDDVTRAVNTTRETFGRLDAVVNCAGQSIAFKTYNFNKDTAHHLDDFNRMLTTNVGGAFNVIRLAAGLMGKNPPDEDGLRGVIINTSAFAAYDGSAGQVAYSASSAAIAGMTLPLARDFSVQGIRCCAIAPGLFDTPLTTMFPEKLNKYFEDVTLSPHRFGKPSEFADLVLSIIRNPFLNGEVIRIDGGFRML